MPPHLVTIHESWNLSFQKEIIAEIQHSLNGLMAGSCLTSTEDGLCWKVVNRVLYLQAKHQKRFNGEAEKLQHLSFQAPFEENLAKFQSAIEEKERNGIYQYAIEPLGHDGKPRPGSVLLVDEPFG